MNKKQSKGLLSDRRKLRPPFLKFINDASNNWDPKPKPYEILWGLLRYMRWAKKSKIKLDYEEIDELVYFVKLAEENTRSTKCMGDKK